MTSYCKIAEKFNKTRTHMWTFTQNWYKLIGNDKNCFILDAGCGNGRNMIDLHTYIGIYISEKLLENVNFKNVFLLKISVCDIPFKTIFDHVLCVSVIHHIESEIQRLKAINELIRVTKINGLICISVWYPPSYVLSNEELPQDRIIRQFYKNTEVERFFYIYDKKELFDICSTISNVKIIEYGINKQANYIFLKKIL